MNKNYDNLDDKKRSQLKFYGQQLEIAKRLKAFIDRNSFPYWRYKTALIVGDTSKPRDGWSIVLR